MSAIERLANEAEAYDAFFGGLCEAAIAELRALQERVEAQQKMLKRLEWDYRAMHDDWYCRICGGGERIGHTPDCELAALLKETT